jgi:hypothetical protein
VAPAADKAEAVVRKVAVAVVGVGQGDLADLAVARAAVGAEVVAVPAVPAVPAVVVAAVVRRARAGPVAVSRVVVVGPVVAVVGRRAAAVVAEAGVAVVEDKAAAVRKAARVGAAAALVAAVVREAVAATVSLEPVPATWSWCALTPESGSGGVLRRCIGSFWQPARGGILGAAAQITVSP